MTYGSIVHALTESWLTKALHTQGWIWPTLEIFHLFGMVLLFGALLIFDLRVLGFAPTLPLAPTAALLKLAMVGFAVNIVTGSLLVLGDAHHFLANPAFLAKMALMIAAGLNAGCFTVFVHNGPANRIAGVPARISAALSLLFWTGVIILARFIAYVESVQ